MKTRTCVVCKKEFMDVLATSPKTCSEFCNVIRVTKWRTENKRQYLRKMGVRTCTNRPADPEMAGIRQREYSRRVGRKQNYKKFLEKLWAK